MVTHLPVVVGPSLRVVWLPGGRVYLCQYHHSYMSLTSRARTHRQGGDGTHLAERWRWQRLLKEPARRQRRLVCRRQRRRRQAEHRERPAAVAAGIGCNTGCSRPATSRPGSAGRFPLLQQRQYVTDGERNEQQARGRDGGLLPGAPGCCWPC